jgi:hypothetical protein
VKQPEPETRGGEEPGSWGVDGTVIAKAAMLRAQLICNTQDMNLSQPGGDEDE